MLDKTMKGRPGDALKAREDETNWANINTEVKFEGKEIKLPGTPENMPYDVAIETLARIRDQETQEFDVKEYVNGAPWDCLFALYRACQDIYGVVTNHSIKTWFGDIKPEFVTINIGPDPMDKIQVPKGLMKVPGITEDFYLDYNGTNGAVLYGTVTKKVQTALVAIANRAREIIRESSIYKNKAITLPVDDRGNLILDSQPEFMDLSRVSETDMIHTRDTESQISTNIFGPLKHTEACRLHRIPLKRGILLEGKYGTGKSLTARVTAKVANTNEWTFINLGRSQGLRAAIEFGRQYQPCVIFAEDIDRSSDRSSEDVNDLVNLIDGVISKEMEMMVVLTTNYIDKIDKSLLRPGRFDAIISLSEPDAETAVRLVKVYARDLLRVDDSQLDRVGALTAGQVPAMIREVVERAKLSMLMESRDHLKVEDLETSALGLKRHQDLLQPKVDNKTPGDLLVEALAGVFSQAQDKAENELVMDEINDVNNTLNNVHRDLKRSVNLVNDSVKQTGSMSLSKSQETLNEVKKIGSRV